MASKAQKPEYNYINASTVYDEVMTAFNAAMLSIGFNENGIDNSNEKKPRYITHNQVNYCFRQVARKLFTPEKPLYNNQKSLINYDNVELLTELSKVFIDICQRFNKSLGLMSFSWLCNIDYSTLYLWLQRDEESNPARFKVLKSIQENHKAIHVALLNESPVGAMAAANNDTETGLKWAANQVQQITNNTVYYLPSERTDKLKLEKLDN